MLMWWTIKNKETQVGQLKPLVNERLPPRNLDLKSQPHVIGIYTEEEIHSNAYLIHETTTIKPDLCLEDSKPEAKRENLDSF